jgi:predicted molibdopterin-dependent oxidoreductase YjgC
MTVTLTINGQQVTAPAGSTILEAARSAGIYIPTLCYHPDLSNVGACRMCVVTVEKARALQTACTTPVFEGMVVHTETEEARATRRFVLTMLLSDHPNDCMRCEVNGDCELQDLVYEYDVEWPAHEGVRHTYEEGADPTPFILIDRSKCILCGRCIRACAEIQVRNVWSFAHRGFASRLVAGADQALLEARCESCGQCVAYCPVGALYDKMSLGAGRATQLTKVRTTCPYCGVGCNFDLNVRDGRVVRVTSAPDAPVNGMALCVKGRYGYDFLHHPERLKRPLVRRYLLDGKPKPKAKGGKRKSSSENRQAEWVEVDWETALGITARRLGEIRDAHGADSIGLLTSAKCLNEENYLMNKFARQVIGTNSIDHCARL